MAEAAGLPILPMFNNLNQVNSPKQENPDDIHKMPIPRGRNKSKMSFLLKMTQTQADINHRQKN